MGKQEDVHSEEKKEVKKSLSNLLSIISYFLFRRIKALPTSSSMNSSRKRPVGEILNQGVEITKEISNGFFIVKVPKILAAQLENVDADEKIGVLERYEEEEDGNSPEDSMIEENSNKKSKKNRHNERYEIRITNPTLLQSGLVHDGSNNLNLGFRPEEYVMQPIERPEDKFIDQNIY